MAALVEAVGPCGLVFTPATFESLARNIVYQQISIRAARGIYAKLLAECTDGDELKPDSLLRLTPERLRACGLSAQKARYLSDLAWRTAEGQVDFARLLELSDQDVMTELTKVTGIGVWTAQMFLIFSLKRPDVLPVSDLGIRNAVKKLYRLRETPNPEEVGKRGRKWRPYASAASWYLWRSLEPSGPF